GGRMSIYRSNGMRALLLVALLCGSAAAQEPGAIVIDGKEANKEVLSNFEREIGLKGVQFFFSNDEAAFQFIIPTADEAAVSELKRVKAIKSISVRVLRPEVVDSSRRKSTSATLLTELAKLKN